MTFDEKASQVRNEADKEAIAQLLRSTRGERM